MADIAVMPDGEVSAVAAYQKKVPKPIVTGLSTIGAELAGLNVTVSVTGLVPRLMTNA